jgi:hypothetical protein
VNQPRNLTCNQAESCTSVNTVNHGAYTCNHKNCGPLSVDSLVWHWHHVGYLWITSPQATPVYFFNSKRIITHLCETWKEVCVLGESAVSFLKYTFIKKKINSKRQIISKYYLSTYSVLREDCIFRTAFPLEVHLPQPTEPCWGQIYPHPLFFFCGFLFFY